MNSNNDPSCDFLDIMFADFENSVLRKIQYVPSFKYDFIILNFLIYF